MKQVELIKKLHLKKGKEYIIFFPRASGISAEEIQRINHPQLIHGVHFLLQTTKGIKVIERDMIKEHENV